MAIDYLAQSKRIQEKYKELREESKEDIKIRPDNLFGNFNTELMIKWINKRSEWNKLLKVYDKDKKEKHRSLFEYYKTEFNIKLTDKTEYSLYIESDSNYIEINNLYTSTKEVIQYIDAIIDAIKARAWDIKSFIDWQKFQNGQ